VPVTKNVFSNTPVGKPFQTVPPGGTEAKAKGKVTVLVSLGQPDVLFSNGKNILRVNGATGAKEDPVADTDAVEKDPTWSADGTHVAYTADGQLMLKNVVKQNAGAVPLRPANEHYADLAWAPTVDQNVLAMRSSPDGTTDSDLCLAQIRGDTTDVSCKAETGFAVTRAIHWAPDGKTILAFGSKLPDVEHSGIVRWRLKDGKKAFSSNENDWNKGKFVSDTDKSGKAVIDAAFSPDNKKIALVSNIGSSAFRLSLTDNTGKADDFLLTDASRKTTRACKVSWRSDSQAVIVVQGAADCSEEVATLATVNPNTSRDERTLNANGNDPSFRPPLPSGG
jgi:Tol biopolymer transport system component